MKAIILEAKLTSEGLFIELSEKANIEGRGMKCKSHFISFDKLGRLLFNQQYADCSTVSELNKHRNLGK